MGQSHNPGLENLLQVLVDGGMARAVVTRRRKTRRKAGSGSHWARMEARVGIEPAYTALQAAA
jgi:hypothetical protein